VAKEKKRIRNNTMDELIIRKPAPKHIVGGLEGFPVIGARYPYTGGVRKWAHLIDLKSAITADASEEGVFEIDDLCYYVTSIITSMAKEIAKQNKEFTEEIIKAEIINGIQRHVGSINSEMIEGEVG